MENNKATEPEYAIKVRQLIEKVRAEGCPEDIIEHVFRDTELGDSLDRTDGTNIFGKDNIWYEKLADGLNEILNSSEEEAWGYIIKL